MITPEEVEAACAISRRTRRETWCAAEDDPDPAPLDPE